MQVCDLGDARLHLREDGAQGGAVLVFLNSFGTDMRVWDGLIARLPPELRIIRYDMRGHGLSDAPDGPVRMGTLIRDAERLMDALRVQGAVLVGAGLGGLVAQGLAVKRLDLVRALVLTGSAPRLGHESLWDARADLIAREGMAALADQMIPRWFGPAPGPSAALLRAMLARQSAPAMAACCAAIARTDFYPVTARLTLPSLIIAGDMDREVPPDLTRETADLIRGARFHLLPRAGHLAAVDAPGPLAALLADFLSDIAHLDEHVCERH